MTNRHVFETVSLSLNPKKMNVKPFLLFVLLVLLHFSSKSQEITGQIEKFDPSINYQLALFSSQDSSLVKTTLADSTGKFEFSPVKPMNYFLVITNDLGWKYSSKEIAIIVENSSIDIGLVVLTEKRTNLMP